MTGSRRARGSDVGICLVAHSLCPYIVLGPMTGSRRARGSDVGICLVAHSLCPYIVLGSMIGGGRAWGAQSLCLWIFVSGTWQHGGKINLCLWETQPLNRLKLQ